MNEQHHRQNVKVHHLLINVLRALILSAVSRIKPSCYFFKALWLGKIKFYLS